MDGANSKSLIYKLLAPHTFTNPSYGKKQNPCALAHYERVVHAHPICARTGWVGSSAADTWSPRTASGSVRNGCAGSCGGSMLKPARTLPGSEMPSVRFRRDRSKSSSWTSPIGMLAASEAAPDNGPLLPVAVTVVATRHHN